MLVPDRTRPITVHRAALDNDLWKRFHKLRRTY